MKNIGRHAAPYVSRRDSDKIAVLKLVANTEQHFTIPTSASVAIFSSTDNFYCLVNGQTAAVPGATSTSFPSPNTVPELNPTVYDVMAGNLCSLVAPADCVVTVSFYNNAV
jgi:hypothetical protein